MVYARDQSKPEPSSLRKWLQETKCVMKFQRRHISDKVSVRFLLRKRVSFPQVMSSFSWSHAFRDGGGMGARLPRILSAHLAHTILQSPQRASVPGEVQYFLHFPPRGHTSFPGPCMFVLGAPCSEALASSLPQLDTDPFASSSFCESHLYSDASGSFINPSLVTLALPGWHHLDFYSVQCLLYVDASCLPMMDKGGITMEASDSYCNCLFRSLCARRYSFPRWGLCECHIVSQLPELSSALGCGSCRYSCQSSGTS